MDDLDWSRLTFNLTCEKINLLRLDFGFEVKKTDFTWLDTWCLHDLSASIVWLSIFHSLKDLFKENNNKSLPTQTLILWDGGRPAYDPKASRFYKNLRLETSTNWLECVCKGSSISTIYLVNLSYLLSLSNICSVSMTHHDVVPTERTFERRPDWQRCCITAFDHRMALLC